jgi:predicted secreted hydrolase
MLKKQIDFFCCIGVTFIMLTSCIYNKHFNADKRTGTYADTTIDIQLHKRNSLEWWYFSSHVKDSLANDYGIMFTVFKRYIPIAGEYLMLNMTVTDEKNKKFYKWYDFQKLKKKHYSNKGVNIKGATKNADWIMHVDSNQSFNYSVNLKKHPIANISITQYSQKPIVFEANNGYMDYGTLGKAGYLSYTNMKTLGRLTINNSTRTITGDGWFDKQWNCIRITQPTSSWIWFGIQFNNHEELMIFKTVNKKNKEIITQASYIDSLGKVSYIPSDDILLTPMQHYLSASLSTYPIRWYFEIKSLHIKGQVSPIFNEHEIDLKPLGFSFMKYWEGKCQVMATKNNMPLQGNAFLEMTRP